MGARKKGSIEDSSVGKKYLGWDFFCVYLSPEFVNSLIAIYPDIDKQEAYTLEERFVL